MKFYSIITFLTLAGPTFAGSTNAHNDICKTLKAGTGIGKGACKVSVKFPRGSNKECEAGVTIVGGSVAATCGSSFKKRNLLLQKNLPLIAYLHKNGTIIDHPGDFAPTVLLKRFYDSDESENIFLSKRQNVISVNVPNYGRFQFNQEYMVQIGRAARGSSNCNNLGEQRCIVGLYGYGFNGFITCASGNRWSVLQFCGAGTFCQTHPSSDQKVLCGF